MSRWTTFNIAISVALSSMGAAGLAFSQELVGNAERGSELFLSYKCYACHGYTGETGSTGVRLNPPRFERAAFMVYVRNPSGRRTPGGTMPAFASDAVTDQVLADIYAYLVSLPSTSPPFEEIQLLAEQ